MDKQQLFKEAINDIVQKKFSLYGQMLANKVTATGSISLAANGQVTAINGDPKVALESVLKVFKEIAGTVAVTSAVTSLRVFAMKNADVKADIDAVLSKFE